MKTLKYLFVAAAMGLSVTSCYDLDLEPKGLLSEDVLFTSEQGVLKYFTILYNELPVEDFNYKQSGNGMGYATTNQNGWHVGNVWEALKGSAAVAAGEACGWFSNYGTGWGYWPYARIRDINTFIASFPKYKENFSSEAYEELIAEARALRAFYYFGMVKRYGGVPIVKEVLDPLNPDKAMEIVRSTEYESWKFIYEDLDYAMKNGSENKGDVVRMNRYSAAALMARAMLYAGSIAKYSGTVGTDGPAVKAGLMTMKPEQAEEFYQYAYNACKFLKEAGFKLHRGADKETAYTEVFIEDQTEEDIMVRYYGDKSTTPGRTSLNHSWDTLILPIAKGLGKDVGCCIQPAWQLIKLYDLPAIEDENGKPIRFSSLDEFWNNDEMEARCRANFFFSGMVEPASGVKFDIQGGYYRSYPGTVADGTAETKHSVNDYTDQYRRRGEVAGEKDENGIKISGAHGLSARTGIEGYSHAGCIIRKFVNYNPEVVELRTLFGSKQPWKIFRYGEVLLNWAEAAYELGLIRNDETLKQEAFVHIAEIRDRAGAKPHAYDPSPEDVGSSLYGYPVDENLEFIRNERARELCYENLRLFDIRRWRVADRMFLQRPYARAIQPYYIVDEGKYIYLPEADFSGNRYQFEKSWYYEQIPAAEIAKNPKLVRNDGY